ncbi:MAG: porphobilinogen synthase, partial [Opitutaceae bacterium]|nr:porphobilinogen synthase [Cytophagales bacterium]
MFELPIRPRRNRKSEAIRSLVEETSFKVSDLIFPMFLIEGENKKIEISSMPGIYRFTKDKLLEEINTCVDLGVRTLVLFPSLSYIKKDKYATESQNPDGLYLSCLKDIKLSFPDVC